MNPLQSAAAGNVTSIEQTTFQSKPRTSIAVVNITEKEKLYCIAQIDRSLPGANGKCGILHVHAVNKSSQDSRWLEKFFIKQSGCNCRNCNSDRLSDPFAHCLSVGLDCEIRALKSFEGTHLNIIKNISRELLQEDTVMVEVEDIDLIDYFKEVIDLTKHNNHETEIQDTVYVLIDFFNIKQKKHQLIIEELGKQDLFGKVVSSSPPAATKISMEQKIKYIRNMIQGVREINEKNIAHLDLKLENMVEFKDDNIKIVDFGQSVFFDPSQDDHRNCLYGQVSGSPTIRSPEQYVAHLFPSIPFFLDKSDVWSLGVSIVELITEYSLFDSLEMQDLVDKIEVDIKNKKDSQELQRYLYQCMQYTVDKFMDTHSDKFPDLQIKHIVHWMLQVELCKRFSIQQVSNYFERHLKNKVGVRV